jgi:hypothetical protein
MKRLLFVLSFTMCASSFAQYRIEPPKDWCVDGNSAENPIMAQSDMFIPNAVAEIEVDNIEGCSIEAELMNLDINTLIYKDFNISADLNFKFVYARKIKRGNICYSKFGGTTTTMDNTRKFCAFDFMMIPELKMIPHSKIFSGANAKSLCHKYLNDVLVKYSKIQISIMEDLQKPLCQPDSKGIYSAKFILLVRR